MTSAYTLKTAPTFEPVSLDDVRDHCRVSTNDEDALLRIYLSAARSWVEAYTQRSLCTQTWQLSISGLPYQMELPRAAPLQTVTFLKYYDIDNVLTTWSSSNYLLPAFHEPALLTPTQTATIPSLYAREDAVQIEYVTGYLSGACPPRLQQAVLMLAAHFYENREGVLVGTVSKEIEWAVTALCAPHRVWWSEPCQ